VIAPAPEHITIVVARSVLNAIVEHARREAPNECCGLLIGSADRIDDCAPTTNLADSPSRFTVDPREHLALARRLRGSGREIVGAYHSHPRSPAVPSPTDIAEAHYPDFIHVIASLLEPVAPDVRAYRIRGVEVTGIALRVDGAS
jgi:proteasome lid subunit RPN8/RPN11